MGKFFLICGIAVLFWGGSNNKAIAFPKNDGKGATFDSVVNFLGTDVNKYVGQELILIEKNPEDRDLGYPGFYNTPESSVENVYKSTPQYYTNYADVAGKSFTVLEAVKHSAAPGEFFENGKCFLKLKQKDSGNIVFFEYNSFNPHSFPFVVAGFFEKQKKLCTGRQLVYSDYNIKSFAAKNDVETGKVIGFITGQIWKCVDVRILPGSHDVMLILQDVIGQKISMPFGVKYFSLSESDNYRKRFGEATYKRVLQGSLNLGMTKEMCKLSIGDPYSVKGVLQHGTDRKKELWHYDDGRDLYFDNDMLVDIQKAN